MSTVSTCDSRYIIDRVFSQSFDCRHCPEGILENFYIRFFPICHHFASQVLTLNEYTKREVKNFSILIDIFVAISIFISDQSELRFYQNRI